jgi:hypothetical protein
MKDSTVIENSTTHDRRDITEMQNRTHGIVMLKEEIRADIFFDRTFEGR